MRTLFLVLLMTVCFGCKAKYPNEYIIEESDIVPEGIAYSESNDVFYLTSVAKSKIIEIDRKTGEQKDFIVEHEFGYSPGVGIYVDDKRHHVHAIGGYYMMSDSLSSLFSFDLITKKLFKRFDLTGDHFLNDMVMNKKGDLFLTDSKDASIYLLTSNTDSLSLFYKSPEIEVPNGIAISEDNSKLYIASIPNGVRILDVTSKIILNERDTSGISQGIDGLEFYNNHLYGIQNNKPGNPFNFRKLILNEKQDDIVGVEVIDSDTPKLDVPLTFCFAGNKAIVIGNSNLQYLNQETFNFNNVDDLSNTRLLVYDIE